MTRFGGLCRCALFCLLATGSSLQQAHAAWSHHRTAEVANRERHTHAQPLVIKDGVLTVDGLAVRSRVNVVVPAFRYLYIAIPGRGTAVISDRAFSGATEERNAFRGTSLTLVAGDTHLQLSSARRLRSAHAAWFRFGRAVSPGLRAPDMAFGSDALVPATWPQQTLPGVRLRRASFRTGRFRMSRIGRLCRPSPHGRERCALIHEVVYRR